MKKILFLLSLIILSVYCKSQDIDNNICKYRLAYYHVFNDSCQSKDKIFFNGLEFSNKNTIVSDSIVFMHKSPFYEYFKKKGESQRNFLLRIGQLDNSGWHDPVYSKSISERFNKKPKNILFVLYFSKPEKNLLFCELMPVRNPLNLSYIKNASFNQSYQYLFIFNENGLVENVIKKEIIYD